MELSLPEELTCTPMSLVALIDLDNDLYGQFSLNRSLDRVPLRYTKFSLEEVNFPSMKEKRNSYEWFIPKGILKRNWLNKHLFELPSVAVLFINLDWDEQEFKSKATKAAQDLNSIRSSLKGRATKLALVLVQKETSPLERDTSEKAASLCSMCELSNRSLFVLPLKAENLEGYVARLENALLRS